MSDIQTDTVRKPATHPESGSGLPENVAGALAYVLGPITGIGFFILDRARPFVRFHAVQCIALSIVGIAVSTALMVLGAVLAFIPILGWLAGFLLSVGLGLGGFVLWIWLMLQAYRGRKPTLPVLAPYVERIAAETGEESGIGG